MIENAYNLENYFFVREQKKGKQKQNKTGKKRGKKYRFPYATPLPFNFIDYRYFLDTGWLSFLKNSKIFWVFSSINDVFMFVIYLFFIFFIVMIQTLSSAVLWLLIL